MEEIQASSDHYRSSSSSASSPATSRVPSSSFFYLRKPGSSKQPISFEDSPEWEDAETDHPRREEDAGDSINVETMSPSLSKINSGSVPSPPLQGTSTPVRRIAGASLVWKDLTVTIKGKMRYSDKVVKSSNGYALPGTLTVIMGPAKSGKSTLLRAIAGLGYVEKEDTLIGSLTVREMLYYSALLQLPGFFSRKKGVVEDSILTMSLGDYSDKLIGGHCRMKSLPRGERRRVSIARELVMRPHLLFIDEPLYQLDSVSALLMMVTLKKLASTGCTIIFTMYQSSTEVFGLFDRICLLSNGNTLFFGETLACLQHFSNAGFPCPIMQSPSDHFLRAINTDFDRIIAMCKNWQDDHGDFSSVNMDTAVAIRTLESTYKTSSDAVAVESMIVKLTEKEGPLLKSKGKASGITRVAVLTWRSLLVMSREWGYFWIRLLLCILLMLSVGTIFYNLGHSLSSVMIYTHEESNQHSGALVFLLGHLLSSIPFLFLISISSSLLFYFLVGMRNEFSLFMYFVLNLFMCLLVNEGLMMVVSSIWLEAFKAIVTMVSIQVLMMLVAGYFRHQNDFPVPLWKYPMSYVAFHTYSIQGLLENEYIGTSFAVGQVRSITGVQALRGIYNIPPDVNAKWSNLLILFLMAICYRIILFVLLRFHVRQRLASCRLFGLKR
ncbi:hypothetical protein AMTRI_Chr07g79560 [Amborella trichopoda]